MDHLNITIMSNEIEAVINTLLSKKSPGLDGVNAGFIAPQQTERGGMLPNSLNEASTILIPKPDKDSIT
jgi:hypothetical protein